MTITLKEVTTLSDLKTFIRFPVRLYQGNPYYVPALFPDELNTLRRDRNPAFEHCERATGWRTKTVVLPGAWPPFSTASTSKNGDKSICVSGG